MSVCPSVCLYVCWCVCHTSVFHHSFWTKFVLFQESKPFNRNHYHRTGFFQLLTSALQNQLQNDYFFVKGILRYQNIELKENLQKLQKYVKNYIIW